MKYLIYIPGTGNDGSPSDLLKSVGLDHLSKAIDVKQSEGPDGERGRLFWWPDSKTAGQFLYKPGTQTWLPSAKDGDRGSGSYWLGFFNDSPPSEEDLRRPDHRGGEFVKLGNDERWSICSPSRIDRFPLLNSDGTITWAVDEAFNWLVAEIDKRRAEALSTMDDEGSVTLTFSFEHDWRFLCSVLQINYRITPEVVSHLRLFSQQSIKQMISELMGMPLKA